MEKSEIIKNINIMLSNKIEKDIPCCEDSTNDYLAYNNLDNMYARSKEKYQDITVFNEFNIDISNLALKLDVDYNLLEGLFRNRHIPSKGLASAIGMVLELDVDTMNIVFNKLGYSFNNSDYDKIIKYFFDNKIYDVSLLNEVLLEFGQMYLYSKRKLR